MPQYIVICASRETGDEYEIEVSAVSAEAARLAAMREGRLVAGVRTGESHSYDPLAAGTATHASGLSSDRDSADRDILNELLNVLQELRLIRDQFERGVRTRNITIKVAIGVALSAFVWPIICLFVLFVLLAFLGVEIEGL